MTAGSPGWLGSDGGCERSAVANRKFGKVVTHCHRIGMLYAERLFVNGQCAFKERSREGKFAQMRQYDCKIAYPNGCVGMIRAKSFFIDFYRALQERPGCFEI